MKRISINIFVFKLLLISCAVNAADNPTTDENQSQFVLINGVKFKDSIDIGDAKVPIRGAKLFEWLKFDVYTGALYAPESVSGSKDVLQEDVSRALVLHYHRSLKAEDFVKSGTEMLKKNPANNLRKIQPGLDKINAAYRDVKKGDEYMLVYDPTKGSTLYLNRKALVTVKGAEFAKAYFGIWLSDYSIDSDFTKALLGEK